MSIKNYVLCLVDVPQHKFNLGKLDEAGMSRSLVLYILHVSRGNKLSFIFKFPNISATMENFGELVWFSTFVSLFNY